MRKEEIIPNFESFFQKAKSFEVTMEELQKAFDRCSQYGEKSEVKIDPRLAACAAFLRGKPLADIGTDHAYLPAALAKSGRIPRAIASDIAQGPLNAAEKTLRAYGVESLVELRKCDGLSGFLPGEAQDIVIAGMGGELIVKILSQAPWLKTGAYRLVLQPMTQEPVLRRWLFENGFALLSEEAVLSGGKVYTVLCAEWRGENTQPASPGFFHAGLVDPGTPAGAQYFEKVRRRLRKMLRGAEIREDGKKASEIRGILNEMKQKEAEAPK